MTEQQVNMLHKWYGRSRVLKTTVCSFAYTTVHKTLLPKPQEGAETVRATICRSALCYAFCGCAYHGVSSIRDVILPRWDSF
jgi:hypothetical protein